MPIIQIATPFNIDIEFESAEFHRRLLAYLIDFMLIILYLYSMIYLLIGGFKIEYAEEGRGFFTLALILPPLFYTFLAELLFNGQTTGKRLLRIKVVSLDGGEATLGQYLLRWLCRIYEWAFLVFYCLYFSPRTAYLFAAFAGIGSVIIILVTNKNQRLGDIVAGTVVVNTRTKLSIEDTVFIDLKSTDYKVVFPGVMRLSDRDINTIKGVLTQAVKRSNYDMCNRVAAKVKEVLNIQTDMHSDAFLEKLLEDYNYLATRE